MQDLRGFLLSYIKYGDHDAILNFFTAENGYQTFFIKGIYSQKNKKKAYLLPLNELQLTFNSNTKSGNLSQISKLELVENRDVNTDVRSNALIFFVADFLDQILKLENKNVAIFVAIQDLIKEIEQKNFQAHLVFLYILIEILGFEPLNSTSKFLNPETGSFENEISHPYFNEEISDLFKIFSNSQDKYLIKIKGSLKKEFLESLLIYYKYHLSDFREPRSLDILKQIFD